MASPFTKHEHNIFDEIKSTQESLEWNLSKIDTAKAALLEAEQTLSYRRNTLEKYIDDAARNERKLHELRAQLVEIYNPSSPSPPKAPNPFDPQQEDVLSPLEARNATES